MSRLSWPCLALILFLVGGCSTMGILQDKQADQQSGMTTPAQQGVMDAAARRAAAAERQARAMSVAAQQAQLEQQRKAQQMQAARAAAGPAKVALLVPLSGKSAPLGQAMVNAAQLALFDIGLSQFELIPRDTKGTTDGAVLAARDALGSGAQLLIGPLFAADVVAVKPVIKQTNVNMLALSTDVSLAEPGVFVMGFAPTPQVERVISFAAAKGAKRFAAIIPSGPYGQLVAKAFEKAVKDHQGTLVISVTASEAAALAAHKDALDAIFMPLGGAELRRAVELMKTAGMERGKIRLLGTGLWDEPTLAQTEPFLIGGWFAAAEPQARDQFMENYKVTYKQEAPRLATLAYDATALAAMLAQNAALYDRETLCLVSGFAGLDGVFRLLPSGQIERGLAVMEVAPGSNIAIDPAPSSFGGR